MMGTEPGPLCATEASLEGKETSPAAGGPQGSVLLLSPPQPAILQLSSPSLPGRELRSPLPLFYRHLVAAASAEELLLPKGPTHALGAQCGVCASALGLGWRAEAMMGLEAAAWFWEPHRRALGHCWGPCGEEQGVRLGGTAVGRGFLCPMWQAARFLWGCPSEVNSTKTLPDPAAHPAWTPFEHSGPLRTLIIH